MQMQIVMTNDNSVYSAYYILQKLDQVVIKTPMLT